MAYASGKHAKGICDRCGQTFKLRELRKEVQDGRLQGSKVCPSCFDLDHPQWKTATAVDNEGLYEPRPDAPDRRISWGWNPLYGVGSEVDVGSVTVHTSKSKPIYTASISGVQTDIVMGAVTVKTSSTATIDVTGVQSTSALGDVGVETSESTITTAEATGMESTTTLGTATATSPSPFSATLVDYSTGVAGTEQTVNLTVDGGDIVFEDTEKNAEIGAVTYRQATGTIIHGTEGYAFEFGFHMFALPSTVNDEDTSNVYQIMVVMKPHNRWSGYPTTVGYDPAVDSTFPKPFKIIIKDGGGAVMHTMEMRDGKPINDPALGQTRNSTTIWRPHVHCFQALQWTSKRLKLSDNGRKMYDGTVKDWFLRPKAMKKHFYSNASIPVFGTAGQQVDGYLQVMAMGKWAMQTDDSAGNIILTAYPRTDEFLQTNGNTNTANIDDGGYWPTHAVGWAYEYGAMNCGHDWRHGRGGQRFERFGVPSQLSFYLTDKLGSRMQGNIPWRDICDEYGKGFFSHAWHHVTNPLTMEIQPFLQAAYGEWGYYDGYYNDATHNDGPSANLDRWIDIKGMGTSNAFNTTDRDGKHHYNGWTPDNQHAYQTPGYWFTHFNSVTHAIEQKFRMFAMFNAWNRYQSTPSTNMTNIAIGDGINFMMRQHAWRWQHMAMMWKACSTHSLLVSRAEIRELWRLHLESIHDNTYVPTTDSTHADYNHPVFAGLRNLGVPCQKKVSGTNHFYSIMDDDKKFYLFHVITMMKLMGCWDDLKSINAKCSTALDFVIGRYAKYGATRLVATKGTFASGAITQSIPTTDPLTFPADWAAVATNMGHTTAADMVRNADGTQYLGPDPDYLRERWGYQHLLIQCCIGLRDHWSSYAFADVTEAATKCEDFEAFVKTQVDGATYPQNNEYRQRFTAAGPIKVLAA